MSTAKAFLLLDAASDGDIVQKTRFGVVVGNIEE
jgi:hypothetical protein